MKRTLNAINAMLASIAQLPVSSAESQNLYVIAAKAVLDRINSEIQEEGYWFNTDYNVTLIPDEDGIIHVDTDTLRILDPVNRMNFVVRGNELYNPITQENTFSSPVTVDIIVELPFEELPAVARNYITRKAIEEFFVDRDGESNKVQKYMADTARAKNNLNSEALRQLGLSAADSPHFSRFTARLSRTKGLQNYRYNRVPRIWVGR